MKLAQTPDRVTATASWSGTEILVSLVYEGSIISPLTHSDAHSIKVCNITSAAKASIHKLGNADLYDAWTLEMEITSWSSEQPQVLNAALLLYKP